MLASFPQRPSGTVLIPAKELLACTPVLSCLTSTWQTYMGSYQLLRPGSLTAILHLCERLLATGESESMWRTGCPEFFPKHSAKTQGTCALVFRMICKVAVPTFLGALGLGEEKWLCAACALMGTLALQTLAVAPWKVEVKSAGIHVVSKGALGTYGKGQVAAGPVHQAKHSRRN